jgi:uncharacterized alkaline shock family protein YloU
VREDEVVSAVVEAIGKARELSAKSAEYFSAVERLDGLVAKQRNLVERTVYMQMEADVPQDLYEIGEPDVRAHVKFMRLMEILEKGPSSMARSMIEIRSSEMVMRRDDRAFGLFVELRKPDLCDIAVIAIVEKYGRVISKILEEVQRKSEEAAEEYRRVAEIAAVVDTMLR